MINNAKEIVELIKSSERIVITAHRGPDGDSVGSSMALLRFIKALGRQADVCHPDPCPAFLNWLKGDDEIIDFENDAEQVSEKLKNADLIFALDYNGVNRLGNEMGELLADSKAKKVMIDHHLHPEDFADITESHTSSCSTCQLIYELIDNAGELDKLNVSIAEPIYLGIVTDTGSFRFDSVTDRTHEIIAQLMKTGLNHTQVHINTFDNNRVDKLKLRGYVIAEKLELLPEQKTAILSLTMEEMERFNYIKGDTEGLVNVALSIEGVEVAAFFTEKEDAVKISFRSKGPSINQLASDHFDGGGHKFAAGGINFASIEETIAKFKSVIGDYVND